MLYTRDGTQITFAAGKATAIQDTNGNRSTFSSTTAVCPPSGTVIDTETAIDSLGRKVKLEITKTCPLGTVTKYEVMVQDNATTPNHNGQIWTLIQTQSNTTSQTWELRVPGHSTFSANKFTFLHRDQPNLSN